MLEEHAPFSIFNNAWLFQPYGGRRADGMSGPWTVNQLRSGVPIEQIIASVQELATTNSYRLLDIRALRGISVVERVDLSDVAYLCPNGELPDEWAKRESFDHKFFEHHFTTDTAALVQTLTISPALVPATADGGVGDHQDPAAEKRDNFAALTRLALGLASGGAVEMPFSYCSAPVDCVLTGASALLSGHETGPPMGPNRAINPDLVRTYLSQLQAMTGGRALELSLDRLLRSRTNRSLEDRTIDLGMAAEIALMHQASGSGDGKAEITSKLSNRAAWLVGTDLAERQQISDTMTALYGARSRVVHTGVADPRSRSRLEEFDAIVCRVAVKLLSRGSFPDWRTLVLGDPA